MKLRSGFVSNSSSSSFVFFGVPLKNANHDIDYEDIDDLDLGIRLLDGSDDGLKDGEAMIGFFLADIRSDEYSDTQQMTMPEFNKKIEQLQEGIKKLGIEVINDPKIVSGTRMC